MCMRNPNIRWGHKEYARTVNEYGRTSVLELCGEHPLHAVRKEFENSQDLCKYLKVNTQPSFRRVIILEGVARNYVEVLGSHFNMDPAFFANQKRPNSWDVIKDGYFVERTANLPSLNDPRRHFMIRYPELRLFPPDAGGRTQLDAPYVKDLDGRRQVYIGRKSSERQIGQDSRKGDFHNVGVFNRAASYWSRNHEDGGWDGQSVPIVGRYLANVSQLFFCWTRHL